MTALAAARHRVVRFGGPPSPLDLVVCDEDVPPPGGYDDGASLAHLDRRRPTGEERRAISPRLLAFGSVLKRMDVDNFKGFDRFTVHFRQQTVLVGPNNAGKSTLIAALRAAAGALRIGWARVADASLEIDGSSRVGHILTGAQLALKEENLRHEFRTERATRVVLAFDDASYLELRWPEGPPGVRCFASFRQADVTLTRPSQVRRAFPRIGVVPVLAPMDVRERAKSPEHVDASVETHRASLHARNQLYRLQLEESATHANQFEEFKAFAAPLIRELSLESLHRTLGDDWLDLDYRESGSRNTKEISWAGDGLQVWLQLLYHFFRLRDSRVVVLDEPDLFLHADLQRRLVRVLEGVEGQVITATHSPEVLAEARQDAVVWISRERRRGARAPDSSLLFQLSETLGTQFNLRLARALRAHLVVFVEGKDMRIVRNLAATVGADAVVNESGIAVIQLEGFDRWEHVEPFQWMVSAFLENAVRVRVVLDRDYRDDDAAAEVVDRLLQVGVAGHVWSRHELENYLLQPDAIARVSRMSKDWVRTALSDVAATFDEDVLLGMERARADWGRKHEAPEESRSHAHARFKECWADEVARIAVIPGKEAISRLNQRLAAEGGRTLSSRSLSRTIRAAELPSEMCDFLLGIDHDAVAE